MESNLNVESRKLIRQLLPIFNEIYKSQEDSNVLYSRNNSKFLQQIAVGLLINFIYDGIKENAQVFYDKIIPVIEAEGLNVSEEQKYKLFSVAMSFKFDTAISKEEWDKLNDNLREE